MVQAGDLEEHSRPRALHTAPGSARKIQVARLENKEEPLVETRGSGVPRMLATGPVPFSPACLGPVCPPGSGRLLCAHPARRQQRHS